MNTLIKKKKKPSLYLSLGTAGILAVLIGFLTTYIIPVIRGTFDGPAIIHIHGFFAFSWIALFLIQSYLIKSRKTKVHMRIGFAGMFIALGVFLTIIPAGLFQVEKGLAKGQGDSAVSNIIGVVTSALMFLSFVAAGFVYRKKPKIHKRLMLLATIVLLWPAWFRFRHYFPSVPRPDIWFAVVLADSLIIISWIADKRAQGKIHPVLFYGGLFVIAEHIFEVLMFDSPAWRVWAKAIYNLFA